MPLILAINAARLAINAARLAINAARSTANAPYLAIDTQPEKKKLQ